MACIPIRALVSVIAPLSQNAIHLEEMVKSVQKQTYPNWELFIVDVFSNQVSEELKEFIQSDSRIHFTEILATIGLEEAVNMAIGKAKGHYLTFIQDEDCWLPSKLEKQLEFMQAKNIAFSYTDYQIVDKDSCPYSPSVRMPEKLTYQEFLKNMNGFGCVTGMIDTYKVGSIKMSAGGMKASISGVFWLSFLKRGFNGYKVQEVLTYQMNSSLDTWRSKYEGIMETWNLYRNVEQLNFFVSAYYFMNYLKNQWKTKKPIFNNEGTISTQV